MTPGDKDEPAARRDALHHDLDGGWSGGEAGRVLSLIGEAVGADEPCGWNVTERAVTVQREITVTRLGYGHSCQGVAGVRVGVVDQHAWCGHRKLDAPVGGESVIRCGGCLVVAMGGHRDCLGRGFPGNVSCGDLIGVGDAIDEILVDPAGWRGTAVDASGYPVEQVSGTVSDGEPLRQACRGVGLPGEGGRSITSNALEMGGGDGCRGGSGDRYGRGRGCG